MKKRIAFFLSAAVFALSAAEIHFKNDADEGLKFAGNDLARCLRKVTGQNCKTVTGGVPKAGDIILEENKDLQSQEWKLQNRDGILYIQGKDTVGIVYGVYSFLEKYAGCSWLAPDTEILPRQAEWKLPAVNETGKPAFSRREMYVGADGIDWYWRLRNKENNQTPFGISVRYGSPGDCHNFDRFVKAIKDPKLFGPKISGGLCHTICMTNPEVRKIILAELIRYIESDRKKYQGKPAYMFPSLYELGQSDGPSWGECWCDSCRKLAEAEGSYAGPNLDFVNYMANGIREKYPDVKLVTFAYAYTIKPPKTIKAADNVIIRYCGADLFKPLLPNTDYGRELHTWSDFAKTKSIWSYWRTFDGSLYPFVKKRQDIADEIRFCQKEGVIHYFAENEDPLSRSFAMMQHWLMLKMLDDPTQDINRLSDKFLNGYYGKAAPVMKEYLEYLERRENVKKTYLDKEFFEKVNLWLDKAEELVKDDSRSLMHVRWERVVLDRTMFQNLAVLQKNGYSTDLKKVSARFKQNLTALIRHWKGLGQAGIAKRLISAEQEADLYSHYPVAIPKQFDGCEVMDLHWTSINGTMVKDPDAVCGAAVINPRYRHRYNYTIGIYNASLRQGESITFSAEDYPQDEKFHLYRVGKGLMIRPLNLIHDSTWNHSTRLPAIGITPETREVWVSMKFSGPAYVKGSKSRDAVLIDRILLVNDPQPLRKYLPPDPKKNLIKNGGFEESSKAWIYHWCKITPNVKLDTEVKHSGRASLRIDGNASAGYSATKDIGKIADMKHDLLIRGWVKYKGVSVGSKLGLPFTGIWTIAKGQNTTYNYKVVEYYPGDYDWFYFEKVLDIEAFKKSCSRAKPNPAEIAQFRILVYHQPGTVWLDDVEVIPLEKKDK